MNTLNDSFKVIKQLYDIIMSYENRHPGTIDRIESENDLDESDSQFAVQTAEDKPLQESAQVSSNDDTDEDSNSWMKAFGNVRQFTIPLLIDEK